MTQVYSHCSNTKKVLGQRSHVTVIIMNDIHLAWVRSKADETHPNKASSSHGLVR